MITTCTVCHTRYRLDASKVPPRRIRVRCPDCGGVFALDGAAAVDEVAAPVEGLESTPAASRPAPAAAPPAAAPQPETPAAAAASTPATAAPAATLDEPRQRKRRSKEEMLARALVSDILVYNRELRDKALSEGNLLESLGAEIKKSWELYKEKVTPEVANSTNHFREALNEILADGQKVF